MLMHRKERIWSRIWRKGPIFAINFVVFGWIAIILVSSFVWLGSGVKPDLSFYLAMGVNPKSNAIVRLVVLGVCALFLYYAFVLERRGNNRLLVIFAVLGVSGELLLRVAGSFAVGASTSIDWRQPQPYFMFSGPMGASVEMPAVMGGSDAERRTNFNGEGFRIERGIVSPKPPNEIRIFVLGGSTVVMGAPLANTIPGVIESSLHAGGLKQALVYNFGIVGSVVGQELSLLVHRLVALQPDVVISYGGGNNLYEPWFYDPRPSYPFNFMTWETAISAISRNTGRSSKTIADLERDSALIEFVFATKERQAAATLQALRQSVQYGTAQWKRKVVEAYVDDVAAMCGVSRANGILFADFFQPTLHYSPNLSARQVERAGGDQLIRGMLQERADVLSTFADGIPGHDQDPGCRFNDLSSIFEHQGSEYFWDLIHVDNRGNQVIGHRIAEELLGWDAFRRKQMADGPSQK
jgi:hypothetical protein